MEELANKMSKTKLEIDYLREQSSLGKLAKSSIGNMLIKVRLQD